MSLSTTQYGYIVNPMVPFTDDKGKTIKNGFIRVFMAGTSTPVLTYRNYDGATNQEKIELDNSGRVKYNVIGSKGSLYKVVVYDAHHSQETPILTVDKIAVLGASINATGATIVTGLDSVTVQEENFIKATVEGTSVELSLDPTEVTSEVSTTAAAVTAAPDYVVPLLDKTGEGDSKKISLANLFKFALDWISRLATTITSFASGDFFAVSNPTDGTRKMSKDTLLTLTAQNAKFETQKAELLNGYYETNGSVLPDFVSSSAYRCTIVYGNVGDKIYVQGIGASGARLWATIDKYNVIKRRADANTDSSNSPTEITLDEGEVGVVFNSNYNAGLEGKVACYYNLSITDAVSVLSCNIHNTAKLVDAEKAVALDEGYRTTNGDYLAALTSDSGYRSAIAYGYEGDSFVIAGNGTNNARTWATIDYSGKIVRRADNGVNTIQSPVVVTLEEGESGIVLNSAYNTSWYYRLVRLEVNSTLGSDLQKSIKKIASLENSESAESANENIVKIPDGFANAFVFPYSSKFNIRAKFVIRDNPYQFATTAQYFFRWKRGAIVGSIAIKAETLTQETSTYTDSNNETHTSYQPFFDKGVSINNSSYLNRSNKFLGNIAFGIQYVGSESSASFECDGEKIILKKGGVATNYAFSTYATMGDLFNAIAADADFVVDYKELENHTPDELAFYGETQLVSTYKRNIGNGSEEIYTDNPMIFLRYGTSGKYHQIEIICDGEKIHRCVDGWLTSENLSTYSQEGDWQIYVTDPDGHLEFTDIEICTNGVRDAEIVKYRDTRDKMISSVNPCVIVYEGHGIYDAPTINGGDAPEGGLETTPDRLAAVFDLLKKKGYVSVPMSKIVGYLDEQNELPKRCYTLVFDDYRFDNVMDLKKRSAFTASGVYANLAVISSQDSPIVIDGETITLKDAVDICRNAKFDCLSHTRSHRNMTHCKYSDYADEISEDVYDGDKKGINGNIIVYPGGNTDAYMWEVMDYLGISAGIIIVDVNGYSPCRWISKYRISRLEIGLRETMANIIKYIV